jgi:hypothetical protein
MVLARSTDGKQTMINANIILIGEMKGRDWGHSNVPSKLRARPSSGCRIPAHESQFPRTVIGLVYSQFDLIKIILKKVNYNFLLF